MGTTRERIALPLHPHPLISFSTRCDFVKDGNCAICQASIEGDGYMCSGRWCEFLIHKRCIQDLYYADGTKAPRVYHGHRLETFVREDTGSSTCAYCRSDELGEFIGCASCQVFYHRNCIRAPENLQYPPHPGHTLDLFINRRDYPELRCESCSGCQEVDLCYHCASCDFSLHIGCALQTLAYCEKGMSASIELTWHEHPLLLCHRTESGFNCCYYCGDESTGPMYVCNEGCGFLLHPQCVEIEPTITHPHHPEHQLTLREKYDGPLPLCDACRGMIVHLSFACKFCPFYLHVKCAARVPTRKHYLHEHELLSLDKVPSLECNRCGANTDSPLFRCVPCNFNLHEKCMELPSVVKHKTHFHPLTLRDSFMEDDSGEYYCDLCEKRRDGRLGVYVCGQCSASWAFHTECILPELRKVFEKKGPTSAVKTLDERIARKNKQVRATEETLKEMKRELDELTMQRAKLISGEENNFVALTEGGEPENAV